MQCGDEHATVGWVAEGAELSFGGETFTLQQARSASGARYVAADDSTTWIWNKGDVTRLSVRGREYAPCRVVAAADETFRAHGNEPFWAIEITRTALTVRRPDGAPLTLKVQPPELAQGSRRYVAHSEGHDVVATVSDRICRDGMSGIPYPNSVVVAIDGREHRGCGGEPSALLHGKEWVVEEVNHAGVIEGSRLTIGFGSDQRLSGRAGCNTYSGSYRLTGESLTVENVVATKKACAPALMQQEQMFLQVLAAVQRFELDNSGGLILQAKDGRTLTARR